MYSAFIPFCLLFAFLQSCNFIFLLFYVSSLPEIITALTVSFDSSQIYGVSLKNVAKKVSFLSVNSSIYLHFKVLLVRSQCKGCFNRSVSSIRMLSSKISSFSVSFAYKAIPKFSATRPVKKRKQCNTKLSFKKVNASLKQVILPNI